MKKSYQKPIVLSNVVSIGEFCTSFCTQDVTIGDYQAMLGDTFDVLAARIDGNNSNAVVTSGVQAS